MPIDLPPGQWSALLVGHQWPGQATMALLAAAADSRAAVHREHDGYADMLRAVRDEHLGMQEGATADTARELFRRGEQTSRDIAVRNTAKKLAYQAARQACGGLREDLESIAAEGHAAIDRVIESGGSAAGQRTAIAAIVAEAQRRSDAAAAGRCADVIGLINDVLGAEPAGESAQAFASRHGADLQRIPGDITRR